MEDQLVSSVGRVIVDYPAKHSWWKRWVNIIRAKVFGKKTSDPKTVVHIIAANKEHVWLKPLIEKIIDSDECKKIIDDAAQRHARDMKPELMHLCQQIARVFIREFHQHLKNYCVVILLAMAIPEHEQKKKKRPVDMQDPNQFGDWVPKNGLIVQTQMFEIVPRPYAVGRSDMSQRN